MGFQSREQREKEMAAMEAAAEKAASERAAHNADQLEGWRLGILERAGFSAVGSELLLQWRADVHRCAQYVAQGASHAQVLRIFRPDAIPASPEATPQEAASDG